ncbi:cupin domain-containing protein [Halobellus limi]|uniref:Cupin domain-containing protein n=1 Tax=Halobellus limi TaxID=699433 RepID=A0A1H6BRM9_9EURY|nr:cupin domain-containing protein [Halobellus limi]QCC49356.1 cupin domain-containing protein [Halobellus limi]SEG63333.1 Cupin domain-containing protein [Halobellus limi]
MTATNPTPTIRRASEITYDTVELAEGLQKGVLLGDEDGTPNFNMRRFILEPGARVPRHTNEVEHEQFVIEGEYQIGIDEEIHTVSAGDSLLIPAGVEHWYRNDSDDRGSFLCVVPKGADQITIRE